jgi:RimJ/RimL family protein N-acetyltransferase
MTELETPRFILRPVGPLEVLRDPGGWRHTRHIYRDLYLVNRPMSLVAWLNRGPFPDQFRRFTSAIVPRGETRAIGYHMVKLRGPTSASFTIGIHDDAWLGKDVAVEARIRIINYYVRHGLQRFTANVAATNFASIFTYRKLGYTYVGSMQSDRRHPETGAPVSFLSFEMLKENWMRGPYAEAGL